MGYCPASKERKQGSLLELDREFETDLNIDLDLGQQQQQQQLSVGLLGWPGLCPSSPPSGGLPYLA